MSADKYLITTHVYTFYYNYKVTHSSTVLLYILHGIRWCFQTVQIGFFFCCYSTMRLITPRCVPMTYNLCDSTTNMREGCVELANVGSEI